MSVAYVLFRPSTQFCFPQLNAETLKASGQAYLIHLFHEHASGPWRRPFLSHSAVRKHRVTMRHMLYISLLLGTLNM